MGQKKIAIPSGLGGLFGFCYCLEVACDSDGGCFGWWCWFILMGFVVGY